ncbi:MAG: universal stress protein [Methanolinea sp.]|nr:MAG: universal stress protein [Methanolinea sp.]
MTLGADLIVIGPVGKGHISRMLSGSVSTHVFSQPGGNPRCPALIGSGPSRFFPFVSMV